MATISHGKLATGKVRAKFYVYAIELNTWGGTIVKLRAVGRGEDNKAWADATPAGEISMTIKNDLAAEQYSPGQEWFVDFTPAPMGEEGMGE